MLSTHYVGKITELAVAQAFLQRGYQVSQPLVADSRYDFVVDVRGKLLKIQVKTGTVKEDGAYIEFATSTSHTNTQGTINHSYKQDEIDYFATMLGTQCYVVPVDRCGSRAQRLRLMPTKNGQIKGIMFATDFEIDKVFPTD